MPVQNFQVKTVSYLVYPSITCVGIDVREIRHGLWLKKTMKMKKHVFKTANMYHVATQYTHSLEIRIDSTHPPKHLY
jgi:hypothetical protein